MLAINTSMLSDQVRNNAYFEALKSIIKPGETTVADVGSGTGLLSFMASKLGAKECYLYEQDEEAMDLSKEIAERNNITNCHFIYGNSSNIEDPTLVDVVVSETLGHYALEENTIESLENAKRFLKPGGVLIPRKVDQFIVPVVDSRMYDRIDIWKEIGYELDFAPARRLALNNLYIEHIKQEDLLQDDDAIRHWDTVDFHGENDSYRESETEWTIKDDRTIYGFALWWNAELVDGVSLSTSPLDPLTHWLQIFLPLTRPLKVEVDQKLTIKLRSDSEFQDGVQMQWLVNVYDKQGKLLNHVGMDTLQRVL